MYGLDILCGISKEIFEIPHKISYPKIERSDFFAMLKFEELFDLRAHKCFWNASVVLCIIQQIPQWPSHFSVVGWRHNTENAARTLLALCEGNLPITSPHKGPVI